MNKLAGMAMFVRVVEHGLGIVLQPEVVLADDLATGRLLPVLPEWSLMPSPMYLIYAQDRRPTAKLRSVIDFLLDRFGTELTPACRIPSVTDGAL
jgi:DNA-binding transcriptional LysR family regulator